MLKDALRLHEQGQLESAQALYRQVLSSEPDQHDALHLLGVLRLQQGDAVQAVELIGRAIQVFPSNQLFYSNCANALKACGRIPEAIACLEQGEKRLPRVAEIPFHKGTLLSEVGRYTEAIDAFEASIERQGTNPAVFYNLGNAFLQMERFEEAQKAYRTAVALKPDYARAYYNLGKACRELKQDEEAVVAFGHAVRIDPSYAKAYYNRGNALQALKRHAEAVADYDRCLSIKPEDDVAWMNKGTALLAQKQYESAIDAFDQAIDANPDVAAYHNNKGNAFLGLHQTTKAVAAYEAAIHKDPLEKDAHFNQAICLLLMGNLARGFEKYEWRWATEDMAKMAPKFTQPAWRGGESVNGKRVLLYCEQGFGDTIQFVRYARMVSELGAHVILVVQSPLLELMKRLDGSGELLADGSPLPPFDFHCPLLSLPHAFQTTLETVPASPAYIGTDAEKVAAWARKLGEPSRPRVGLVFSGRPEHKNDENRSLSLAVLLKALPSGPEYICLQKDIRPADAQHMQGRSDIREFSGDLKDFSDTAALIEHMDLVVSVDTSVAHLAAAMGKPTWILLPYVPDWRWLLDRQDSPWYPSVTLFRQQSVGDWSQPLQEVRRALMNAFDQKAPKNAAALPSASNIQQMTFTAEAGRLPVLLNWQAGVNFGWGILGLNIFAQWANDKNILPLLAHEVKSADIQSLDPLRKLALASALDKSNQFSNQILKGGSGLRLPFPLIDPLGNGLEPLNTSRGKPTIGRCIFEDTRLENLNRKLSKYDALLTGSHWNRRLLEQHTHLPVEVIHEGVDISLFHPGPRSGVFKNGRFHVFSGGKIEYRKGQDLVLKAFSIFAKRHGDAVLVTAWQSPFGQFSKGFQGILDHPLALAQDGRGLDIRGWAVRNGLEPHQIIDLGNVPNAQMPVVLREMDCAVQVSRAEACTNLPVKEAMACGLPVIVGRNTGMLDLIAAENCVAIDAHGPVNARWAGMGTEGWGECDVEALVDALEKLYTDTDTRLHIGVQASRWITENKRTWLDHAQSLKTWLLTLSAGGMQ